MWDPPRALMTSAIPTLLRRLEANWATVAGRPDLTIRGVPLPEHAPGALFSDLNLPEVEIVAPRPFDAPPRIESMSVPQALGEFVPGRSSRRFAVESGRSWHWVPRPSPDEDGALRSDVSQWVTRAERAGEVACRRRDAARPPPVAHGTRTRAAQRRRIERPARLVGGADTDRSWLERGRAPRGGAATSGPATSLPHSLARQRVARRACHHDCRGGDRGWHRASRSSW